MKRLLFALVLCSCAFSCSSELDVYEGERSYDEGLNHDLIVLGDKMEDPFTLDNMTKAMASLYPTKAQRVEMTETDLYVRFLPSNELQYRYLESLGVEMVDHPVDYRIVREGDYYMDPSLPDDGMTWQYAVVGKDFVFPPGIEHEILDRCYLPEHDPSTKASGIDWDAVERESFRLTGNADMLEGGDTRAGGASGKEPAGNISIVDDGLGKQLVGVKGVKVSCNVFVRFGHAYTDENGDYRIHTSFSSSPRYRILFKNIRGFGIGINLMLVPASFSTLGKNPSSGVDVRIDGKSDRKLFTRCAVNNAVYDYFSECLHEGSSIKAPPSNLRIWLFQNLSVSSAVMLQQGPVIDKGLISDFLGEYSSLIKMFMPDITLGLKGLSDYPSIYSVAIHECAHASHYSQVGNDFWNHYIGFILKSYVTAGWQVYGTGVEKDHGYCELGEMWAYYVQAKLFRERYSDNSTVYGTSYWFSPQVFLYMDERGLDRHHIFKALTSDVTDLDVFKDKLKCLYPEMKSTINQAFDRYNK